MEEGFEPTRITGGHLIMTKENKRSVPVPIHGNGIDLNILKKQLTQAPPQKKPEEKSIDFVPKQRKSVHMPKPHPTKKVELFRIPPKTVFRLLNRPERKCFCQQPKLQQSKSLKLCQLKNCLNMAYNITPLKIGRKQVNRN